MRGWEMHAIRVTKDLEMRCSQFGEKINEFRVESLLTAMARPIWCGKQRHGPSLSLVHERHWWRHSPKLGLNKRWWSTGVERG